MLNTLRTDLASPLPSTRRGEAPTSLVRSVAIRRGLVAAWLAVLGFAVAASAKGDAWQAKEASKRAGSSSLINADLAAIGERLQRRVPAAPSGKPVAFVGGSPSLAAQPAISPRRMRAERERPSDWDVV